jgi:hypothetical protein
MKIPKGITSALAKADWIRQNLREITTFEEAIEFGYLTRKEARIIEKEYEIRAHSRAAV